MKEIGREEVIFDFEPGLEVIEKIKPGEQVRVSVRDGFNEEITSPEDTLDDLDWDKLAPATGPIGITGAEPGDILKIDIENIELDDQGAMVTIPDAGCYGDMLEEATTRLIPIEDGEAVFNEDIRLEIDPMIGVLGTMPADERIDTGNPGRHGGNMDIKKLTAGSSLYLPVFEESGKISLGDMHALMGDGEVSICGVEIGGEITLRLELIKDKSRRWPMLKDEDYWYAITSHEDLEKAIDLGLEEIYDFLEERIPLERPDIVSLLSIAGEVEICQLVNPRKTIRVGISRDSLENYEVSF
ncbi:acetamidase/formamidase family protein [Halarsenatibacter silvermanii]|uniref:Amidase n=1 Tax=Halarsenatibacter silvermanii TaxID=321763 RepID=A0A1G9MUW5_9FIRM|nr:acetamidase/formamidase family protein [Halarsenatibacter silvermanii]SDL78060.1 amidase [Halarsenatibacter silvermanii]